MTDRLKEIEEAIHMSKLSCECHTVEGRLCDSCELGVVTLDMQEWLISRVKKLEKQSEDWVRVDKFHEWEIQQENIRLIAELESYDEKYELLIKAWEPKINRLIIKAVAKKTEKLEAALKIADEAFGDIFRKASAGFCDEDYKYLSDKIEEARQKIKETLEGK